MQSIAIAQKARLFQFIMLAPGYLELLGNCEAAQAFRRASASEDLSRSNSIFLGCWDKGDALTLRKAYKGLASVLNQTGLSLIRIVYPGCAVPWEISAQQAAGGSLEHIPPMPNLMLSLYEIRRLDEMMREGQNPMSLVHLESDWQVWVNDPLTSLLNVDRQQACQMNMRANWLRNGRDDGLAHVKRVLREQSKFQWNYTTQLKLGILYHFTGDFRLELGGQFRFVELLRTEPVGSTASI